MKHIFDKIQTEKNHPLFHIPLEHAKGTSLATSEINNISNKDF